MSDKKDITKKYSNGEVTIVWQPSLCAHSTLCWKGPDGLGSVFNPDKKPWIDAEGATSDQIVKQIEKCPSGALSYYYNDDEDQPVEVKGDTVVEVSPNGPLMIYGNVEIKLSDGSTEKKSKVAAMCRCGLSGNKPYCDGSHKREGWSE